MSRQTSLRTAQNGTAVTWTDHRWPGRTFTDRPVVALGRFFRLVLAVEAQGLPLGVEHRQQRHGPPPNPIEGRQRGTRMLRVQIDPLVAVVQQQLPAVLVVGVLDEDERLSEVRELVQDLVFDLLEVARVDLVVAGPLVEREREELLLLTELLREELVDE